MVFYQLVGPKKEKRHLVHGSQPSHHGNKMQAKAIVATRVCVSKQKCGM
jgi:hypothetical protein